MSTWNGRYHGHTWLACTRVHCNQDCDGDGQIHRFGHVSGCSYRACGGCRIDSGLDCLHEALSICSVCGGLEGSLLPVCPGRRLTPEEDQRNYQLYCEGIGPFGCANHWTLEPAKDACYWRLHPTIDVDSSQGARILYDAVCELWNFVMKEESIKRIAAAVDPQ